MAMGLHGLGVKSADPGSDFLDCERRPRIVQRTPDAGSDGIQSFCVFLALALPEPDGVMH
ncbi:hypothetical protein [Methylobacterium haplocladii]|uniref:hypothetical protein n=1 Tax=Methylobacterium haplocladii TaxID=1176176 RepID=UPI0014788BC6